MWKKSEVQSFLIRLFQANQSCDVETGNSSHTLRMDLRCFSVFKFKIFFYYLQVLYIQIGESKK